MSVVAETTTRGAAMWATGTTALAPCQAPPAVGTTRAVVAGVARDVGAELLESDGEEVLPSAAPGHQRGGSDPRVPNSVIASARKHGRPHRHGRDVAALLLEQDVQLGQAHAAAAEVLGQGDAEQSGAGQFAPQVAVDPVGGATRPP